MTKLAVPTVHLNGTSRESLLEGYSEAIRALNRAETKMTAACPNARDYYVQDGPAFGIAMDQHTARMKKLREIISELEEIAVAVSDT